MPSSLSEGEQNRLITAHMELVAKVAAGYRGSKDIPFEDLEGSGALGLVEAARHFNPPGIFADYAASCIHNSIKTFIKGWEVFESLDDPKFERDWYEYDIWSSGVPFEGWTSLVATPEELVAHFDEIAKNKHALESAMIALDKKERDILMKRFVRKPPQTLESLAREYKMSYSKTIRTVDRAIRKLRDIIANMDRRKAA